MPGFLHLSLSSLRNREPLWILPTSRNGGDKENITMVKDFQVRSRVWSAERLQAGIFSPECHQVCLHLTESSLPSTTVERKLAYNKLYSLGSYSCGWNGDAVILSKWKWRGHWSHLMLSFHFQLIHLFLLIISPPISSQPTTMLLSRSDVSYVINLYHTKNWGLDSFRVLASCKPDKAVRLETQV